MARKRTEVLFLFRPSLSFLILPSCKHHLLTMEKIHTHTHTQPYSMPEQTSWKLLPSGHRHQETTEFLAWGRIDDWGQVIVAELTCVERSALWCEGWAQSLRQIGLWMEALRHVLHFATGLAGSSPSRVRQGHGKHLGSDRGMSDSSAKVQSHLPLFCTQNLHNGHILSRWFSSALCPD